MKKKPIVSPSSRTGSGLLGQPDRPRVCKAEVGRNWEKSAPKGSRLIGQRNKVASVQVALRLSEPEVARAREFATQRASPPSAAGQGFATGRPVGRYVDYRAERRSVVCAKPGIISACHRISLKLPNVARRTK